MIKANMKLKFTFFAVIIFTVLMLFSCSGKFTVSGNIVDVYKGEIFPGTVIVEQGKIKEIIRDNKQYPNYIMPGFIDSHVHIESSMLTPSEFAKLAVTHGTVATVSDPHEIANVLGIKGIQYMIENAKTVPFYFYFGASSCVPATTFETSGAQVTTDDVKNLLGMNEVKYLSEMMNYPGVIFDDPEILAKIKAAGDLKKPVDGHAPGLSGKDLIKYIAAGISTDHETMTYAEGFEKIKNGMMVIIREGSAAKNFDELIPLIKDYPDMCMFCSDDKHPDDLVNGHINEMVKKAVKLGYDKMSVIRSASIIPIKHYNLDTGFLQKDQNADFIEVDDLDNFNVIRTYIKGKLVSKNGKSLISTGKVNIVNNFNANPVSLENIKINDKKMNINVIQAIDGQLLTKKLIAKPKTENGFIVSDPENDILKFIVVNRYSNAPVSIGFIKGFGLTKGAIATSVAHDSHNVLAVGVTDSDIVEAINLIIKNKGGLAFSNGDDKKILPLPVAGLMSDLDGVTVAKKYTELTDKVKSSGSSLRSPYMTLSFMALLVIPEIKLSDKGLFDGKNFKLMDLYSEDQPSP